jgi:hypothetical protein
MYRLYDIILSILSLISGLWTLLQIYQAYKKKKKNIIRNRVDKASINSFYTFDYSNIPKKFEYTQQVSDEFKLLTYIKSYFKDYKEFYYRNVVLAEDSDDSIIIGLTACCFSIIGIEYGWNYLEDLSIYLFNEVYIFIYIIGVILIFIIGSVIGMFTGYFVRLAFYTFILWVLPLCIVLFTTIGIIYYVITKFVSF